MKSKWCGTWPANCGGCGQPLNECASFYDAYTPKYGCWGLFCPICAKRHGVRTGTGRGQKYNSETLIKEEG